MNEKLKRNPSSTTPFKKKFKNIYFSSFPKKPSTPHTPSPPPKKKNPSCGHPSLHTKKKKTPLSQPTPFSQKKLIKKNPFSTHPPKKNLPFLEYIVIRSLISETVEPLP